MPTTEFQGTERFQVLRSLGAGTFGTVYEALDRLRGIPVALKVPHESRALGLLLFKQEFRSLAEVSHPNLVTLYELVGRDDQWFFTMERVNGVDCLAALRPGQARRPTAGGSSSAYLPSPSSSGTTHPPTDPERVLPTRAGATPTPPADPDQVRDVFRQMTEGLLALHRAGLVHRDLKPSNVLVTPEGRVVILDFGLTLDLEGAEAARDPGGGVGTPAYCSPEQLEGAPPSPASDLYSLGVMLYQALVGQLPFDGTPLDMVRAKRTLDVLPPGLLVPGLPSDLERLALELLDRSPARRPSGEEVLARLSLAPPPEPWVLQTVPLGRVQEIRTLLGALDAHQAGHPVRVHLLGASGMGKSMLMRHFLKLARRRIPRLAVLRARCHPGESLPFKALDGLVDDLSRLLRNLEPGDLGALLPERIPALARLFPVLNQVPTIAAWKTPPEADLDPQALRHQAASALRELLTRLTRRRPVLLAVEDLHWTDDDSLPLLQELLRSPAPPCLILFTLDEEHPDGAGLWQALGQPGTAPDFETVEVDLQPLAPEQAFRVARALLRRKGEDAEPLARWAAELSGGHPLFLAELTHAARSAEPSTPENLPRDVGAFLFQRLADLPPEARELAELLCLAGHPLTSAQLAQAAGDPPDGEHLLAVLRHHHLLKTRARHQVEAYHEGMRQLLLGQLPPDRVQQGHRRLADVLAGDPTTPSRHLATHFAAAGIPDQALPHALRAADEARQSLAFHQEAHFLQLALDQLPEPHAERAPLARRCGEALARAGRSRDAAMAFLRASHLHEGEEALALLRQGAEEYFRCGLVREGVAALEPVLRAVGVRYPHGLPVALGNLLRSRLRLALRGRTPGPLREDPDPKTLRRVDTLWALAMGLGPLDVLRAQDFQARQLRLALDAGEVGRLVRGLAHEVVFQALGGNRALTRTRELLTLAQSLADGSGHPEALARVKLAEGISAVLQGRWQSAARLLGEAGPALQRGELGLAYERHMAQFQSMVAWSVMGDLGHLGQQYQVLTLEAQERGDLLALCNLRSALGYQVFLARNDAEGARRMLDATAEEWGQGPMHTITYHVLISRVNVALYQGRISEARDLLRSEWGRLRASLFLRPQIFRITSLELRARTRLAQAALARPGSLRRAWLLRLVAEDALRIRREHTGYGDALALRLEAGRARLRRDKDRAMADLHQAQEAFRASDMHLHAALCGRTLSRWIEDDALYAATDSWLRGQGIQNPEAWCRMHLPV